MRVLVAAAVGAASLVSACDGGNEDVSATVTANSPQIANSVVTEGASPKQVPASTNIEDPAEEMPEDNLTGPRRNAVRSAQQYLNMSGFSREGLIDQLSSEHGNGYSVEDATAAVDSLDVDWNENAARSAEQYLEMTGFSCKGLIDQLSSDYGNKYTVAQATYGAEQAGAC